MEDLFQGYDNNPGFQEMPGTPRSELVFYSKPNSLPRSFAWSTEPGIYHGDMVFRNQPGDKVVVDTELLPYPKKDNKGVPIAPLSMTMSEFHFLLLYEDQLQVICKLNAAIVFENDFNPRQMRLRGIAHDFVKGTVWIYGEQAVYEVVITNEDRDVWKLFLEKNQVGILDFCISMHPPHFHLLIGCSSQLHFNTARSLMLETKKTKCGQCKQRIFLRKASTMKQLPTLQKQRESLKRLPSNLSTLMSEMLSKPISYTSWIISNLEKPHNAQ